MRVAEFRELIDRVYYWQRSLKSARPEERVREASHVRSALNDLCNADWPKRARKSDILRAQCAVDSSNEMLAGVSDVAAPKLGLPNDTERVALLDDMSALMG